MKAKFLEVQKFLTAYCDMSRIDSEKISEHVRSRTLAAGEYFEMQGDVSQQLAFVHSGLFRSFHRSANGDEFIGRFFEEHEILGSYASLVKRESSLYYLQAIEPSVILTLNFAVVQALSEEFHSWEKAVRLLVEYYFVSVDKKAQKLLMCTAAEHYESFVTGHPELSSRIPQYMIASYLGISPVSLSRIVTQSRSKKAQ